MDIMRPGLILGSGVVAMARTKPPETMLDADGNLVHDPGAKRCQCAVCVPDPFAGIGADASETGRVYRRAEHRSNR